MEVTGEKKNGKKRQEEDTARSKARLAERIAYSCTIASTFLFRGAKVARDGTVHAVINRGRW